MSGRPLAARAHAAVLAIASYLALAGSAQAPVIDPIEVDAWFQRVVEERGFSGVVLIARGGDVLLHEGYGLADDETGSGMTAATVILTGSISKQFTAAAILLLEESGRLAVGDAIGVHLDGVPGDKQAITIHHLLTHTAGFTRDHFSGDLTPMSFEEGQSAIYGLPLGFEPGDGYHYSNTGYAVLAMIVQEVSGVPFQDFVREEVFRPYRLTATGFFGDDWSGHPVANTYSNGVAGGPPSEFPGPFWGNMGNAGVMSTADDLYRWLTALRTGRVLSAENTERIFRPHVTVRPGESYGYGWSLAEETPLGPRIGHGGLGLGGNSEIAWYPDHDLTIVVLSNRARYRFDDEGKAIEASLPAHEALERLVANLAAGDFAALPEQTLVRSRTAMAYWPITFGAAAAGVAVVAWRRRRRRAKRRGG